MDMGPFQNLLHFQYKSISAQLSLKNDSRHNSPFTRRYYGKHPCFLFLRRLICLSSAGPLAPWRDNISSVFKKPTNIKKTAARSAKKQTNKHLFKNWEPSPQNTFSKKKTKSIQQVLAPHMRPGHVPRPFADCGGRPRYMSQEIQRVVILHYILYTI
jgi:hypothetical protein